MALELTSFTPTTVIQSGQVNTNFSAIQTAINGLRPTVYITKPGILGVETDIVSPIPIQQSLTFVSVSLIVKAGGAPTGDDLIIDITKNGTTIFSTKPQIDASATTGGSSAVFSSSTITAGDVLRFNIDQIGSTYAGNDLTVSLVMKL